MFNIFASIVVLLAPVFLYFLVIRPRLKKNFTDLYQGIDSFWARWWARIYAFRSPVIGAIGALLAALPDILVKISSLDFSTILPQPWGLYVGTTVGILIPIMKAFETTPREQPPAA